MSQRQLQPCDRNGVGRIEVKGGGGITRGPYQDLSGVLYSGNTNENQ